MTGRLTVVGIGPGRAEWCTPAAVACLRAASDIVGYAPYVDMADVLLDGWCEPTSADGPAMVPARRHRSDNRVEAERARHALDLAAAGGAVVVVSSGDPGVFAMASAVLEQLDSDPDRWHDVLVDVEPGISAAHALASRVGAPLGHDFCVISLSDVLKPWSLIERRLDAVAAVDLVIALYNPRSRHRPFQLAAALAVIGRHRAPETTVVVGRDVGRPGERVHVTSLAEIDTEAIDMRTVLIVGSSATTVLDRPSGSSVYTPRRAEVASHS